VAVRPGSMPRRTVRPTQHSATATRRAGTSTLLLVRSSPSATAKASGPGAKKDFALNQPELQPAMRVKAKGAKKRRRSSMWIRDNNLDDAGHLVTVALAAAAGDAVRDLTLVLLFRLVDLGMTAVITSATIDGGILALQKLPRS